MRPESVERLKTDRTRPVAAARWRETYPPQPDESVSQNRPHRENPFRKNRPHRIPTREQRRYGFGIVALSLTADITLPLDIVQIERAVPNSATAPVATLRCNRQLARGIDRTLG